MSLNLDPWHSPDRGVLFVVSGASGTGKTTLVRQALATVPGLRFSVSATTRQPREGEANGRDYFFLTPEEFETRIGQGDFLEWAEVYGNRYGTLRAPVEQALEEGDSILLEIDVQGARQIREQMPDSIHVFVVPPSRAALENRLRRRSTDDEATIQRRLREADEQFEHAGSFDYVLVNEKLAAAHDQFQAIFVAELQRVDRNPSLLARFLPTGGS